MDMTITISLPNANQLYNIPKNRLPWGVMETETETRTVMTGNKC